VCVLEMVCVHGHVFLCGAWLIVDDIVVHVWSSCALSLHCHRLTMSRCQPHDGIIIVAVLACLACQCSVLHSHTQDTGTPPLMVPLLPLLCCYCERQAPIVEEQAPSSQPYMSPFVGAPAAMVPTPSRDTPSMWSFPAPPTDSEAVPLTGTTGAVQPVAGAEGTPAGSATGSAPHGPRQAGPEAELDPFPGVVFPEVPMGTPAPPQPLPVAFRQPLPASLPMHFAPVGVTVDGTPGVASEVRGVGANRVASGGPPPPPPPPLPVAPWLHQPAGLPEAGIHTSALASSSSPSSSSSTTTTGAGASGRDDGALPAVVAPAPQASAGREGDLEVLPHAAVGAVGDSLAGPGASVGPTGPEDLDAADASELTVPASTQQ
jgi:hypothetical protein